MAATRIDDKWFKVRVRGIHGEHWFVFNEASLDRAKDKEVLYSLLARAEDKVIGEITPTTKKIFAGMRPTVSSAYFFGYRIY